MTGDSQTAYLLALAFDLVPAELRGPVADQLVANLERHDRMLTTGFLGVALLCPVLTAIGRADLAYALLHEDRFPSWGYSVRHGATTIWERWNGWTAEDGFAPAAMNSFNHYALGAIGEWLFADVAGIAQAPDSVGYRHLLIRPRPGGRLTAARASYLTPYGRVATDWELTGAALRLAVEVPPGDDALVVLPAAGGAGVRLDGAPPERTESYDHQIAVRVGSGRHAFSCPAPPAGTTFS
jgi:alpha-L-rhamnosidase